MSKNWKPIRIWLVIVTVLGILCGSSVAFAAAQPAVAAPQEKQVGMYMAGFDAAVAKANGYKIVTYANGDQQSVPIDPQSNLPKSPILKSQGAKSTNLQSALKSQLSKRAVAPAQQGAVAAANTDYNEVWGNCGRAWIRVTQTGASKVSVASGFSNTPWAAFFWIWDVSLSDANGTSHQTHSGVAAGTAASRIWTDLNQFSWTYDYVYSGGATLVNGTICLAGQPDVSISGL